MEYKQAVKIAVDVLQKQRRVYAPEAMIYKAVNDPALEAEYLKWKLYDDAIKAIGQERLI